MAYNHPKGTCYVKGDDGFCFIPIPKNSSTTVRKVMSGFKTLNFIEKPSVLTTYTTFCVLREPIGRFCSAYIEILKRREKVTRDKNFMKVGNEKEQFYSFIEEVYTDGFFDCHIEPQLFYITDLNNNVVADKIYKIENTNQMLKELFSLSETRHVNSTRPDRKEKIKSFLDENKKYYNRVLEMYQDDIKFFKELK